MIEIRITRIIILILLNLLLLSMIFNVSFAKGDDDDDETPEPSTPSASGTPPASSGSGGSDGGSGGSGGSGGGSGGSGDSGGGSGSGSGSGSDGGSGGSGPPARTALTEDKVTMIDRQACNIYVRLYDENDNIVKNIDKRADPVPNLPWNVKRGYKLWFKKDRGNQKQVEVGGPHFKTDKVALQCNGNNVNIKAITDGTERELFWSS